jgi:hypothetical protein
MFLFINEIILCFGGPRVLYVGTINILISRVCFLNSVFKFYSELAK